MLNSLKKILKKELGLGFDNLVKSEYLNIHSVTNGTVADCGINTKFSNEINNDEFLDPLSTIKSLRLSNGNRVVIGNLNINSIILNSIITNFPNDIEGLFLELNFRKCEWLLLGTYHPPSQSDQYFFEIADKALDMYSYYDKILLTGDLNIEIYDHYLESFL